MNWNRIFVIKALLALFIFVLLSRVAFAQDTVKLMYYNILNYPGSSIERYKYFKTIVNYIDPDIVALSELQNEIGAQILLDSALKNCCEDKRFNRAIYYDGTDSDNMLYFNTVKFDLLRQDTIGTPLRLINKYILRHKGERSSKRDHIIIYIVHLKASKGKVNESKRREEIAVLLKSVNELPKNSYIIICGDMNFYSNDETAYKLLLSNDKHKIIDPEFRETKSKWNNKEFSILHTQSTRDKQFGGGSHGGLDDRFDYFFISENMISSKQSIHYINNSLVAEGNNGKLYNQTVKSSFNDYPTSFVESLYAMSDHLPITIKVNIETSSKSGNRAVKRRMFNKSIINK